LREHTAFRRIRIDVVEVRKIRRILEIAEGRHAMSIGILRRRCKNPAAGAGRSRTGEKAQRTAAAEFHRIRTVAALWPLSLHPTTRSWGTPTPRILASFRDGQSDPSVRYAACHRSIAAPRKNSTAGHGQALWWRRPDPRDLW